MLGKVKFQLCRLCFAAIGNICIVCLQCLLANVLLRAGEISGYSVWFKWAFMDVTSNLENGNILDGAFMYFLGKRAVKMVYVHFHKMPTYNTTTEPIKRLTF